MPTLTLTEASADRNPHTRTHSLTRILTYTMTEVSQTPIGRAGGGGRKQPWRRFKTSFDSPFLVNAPADLSNAATDELLTAIGRYKQCLSQRFFDLQRGVGWSGGEGRVDDGTEGCKEVEGGASNVGWVKYVRRYVREGMNDVSQAIERGEATAVVVQRNPRCVGIWQHLIVMCALHNIPVVVSSRGLCSSALSVTGDAEDVVRCVDRWCKVLELPLLLPRDTTVGSAQLPRLLPARVLLTDCSPRNYQSLRYGITHTLGASLPHTPDTHTPQPPSASLKQTLTSIHSGAGSRPVGTSAAQTRLAATTLASIEATTLTTTAAVTTAETAVVTAATPGRTTAPIKSVSAAAETAVRTGAITAAPVVVTTVTASATAAAAISSPVAASVRRKRKTAPGATTATSGTEATAPATVQCDVPAAASVSAAAAEGNVRMPLGQLGGLKRQERRKVRKEGRRVEREEKEKGGRT
eukprot:GHVQ01007194.1.p2 GENE.GHVQ01007194.1~~GHVQ01007194.1.p2  ORF type:complete len:467 (-),score=89.16 GHVQ01007194.1:397-1797(-)